MQKNHLGIAIIKGVCNSEAKGVTVELAEVALDSLLDDGVLKEIPGFNLIIACRKTWTSIHDQLFLRKVAGFIQASPQFIEAEKEAFAREHLDDPKKAQRLGDVIVLILDRLDDLEKPFMFAKAFAALVRGKIATECFRRLAAAIDIGFIEDLKALAYPQSRAADSLFIYLPNLVRTGLAIIGEKPDDSCIC